jgi:hypothetical protein
MNKKAYNPTALLIRRFVAITLTVLAVLTMFWPSAVALGGTFRTEEKSRMQEYQRSLEDFADDDPYAEYMRAYAAYSDIRMLLETRIEKAEKQGDSETARALRTVEDALEELNANRSIEKINRTFFSGVFAAFEDLGVSFEEAREILSGLPYYTDKSRELWPDEIKPFDSELKAVKIGAIGYNVLFFLVIALGAGAVVMMLLNRSGVVTLLHAIFSLLLAGLAIGLWVILLIKGENLLIPGVSAFAMPIFAIAACFVYRRDKNCKGVFPKRTAEPVTETAETPVEAPVSREQMQQLQEEPAQDEWICSVCNGRNALTDETCAFCGSGRNGEQDAPQPIASEPEPPRCKNCGEPVLPDMKFCVRCGTKLE